MTEVLSPRERVTLSVDTSERSRADRLTAIAEHAGIPSTKMGLELSSAESWLFCSRLAARHNLGWVADAKLSDISNTIGSTLPNLLNLPHPPIGITIHAASSLQALERAQQEAGEIKMLGVTVLTDIGDKECYEEYEFGIDTSKYPPTKAGMAAFRRHLVMSRARKAARAGLAGFVSAPVEVGMIKEDPETRDLYGMIPGTRSKGVAHGDQARVTTPVEAIQAGADLLVIGRQITQAEDPAAAFEALVAEIGAAQHE